MTVNFIELSHPAISLPEQLSAEWVVESNRLVQPDCMTTFKRWIIPGYASQQATEVTHYFLDFFKDWIAEKQQIAPDRLITIIQLAEDHIKNSESLTQESGDLERYILGARIQLNHFDAEHTRAALQARCIEHNKALFTKWDKLRFEAKPEDKEIFFVHPDLVDFIFKTHLHRHIRHQDYQHTIEMLPVMKQRGGVEVIDNEAHLLMCGRKTAWSQIRNRIKQGEDERLYSHESEASKQYWMYLDEGFVPHNRYDLDTPYRFKKLEVAPRQCQVQIVTSHAPQEKWGFADRLLKGTRHTSLRLIIREGFERDHPDLPFKGGEVYSIGWGAEEWRDFSQLSPLASLKGQLFCPDSFEFFAEDLYETTQDTTDEKVIKVFEIARQWSHQNITFHSNTSNCTTISAQLLKEAGIEDLEVKEHMAYLWYRLLVPKSCRRYLDPIGKAYQEYVPDFIQWPVRQVGGFFYACLFIPIFSLLGAWKRNLHFAKEVLDPENPTHIEPLFSRISDLFDSEKMSFDLSMHVYKWQKKQAKLHPLSCRLIKQT